MPPPATLPPDGASGTPTPTSHRVPASAFATPDGSTVPAAATAGTIAPFVAVTRVSFAESKSVALTPVPSTVDVEAGVSAKSAVLLDPIDLSNRAVVQFRDVNCYVPRQAGAGGPLALIKYDTLRRVSTLGSRRSSLPVVAPGPDVAKPDKPAMRQVLYSITGCCLPGELLAFMGPSGSGKTTLLSILGGRVPKGATVAGAIEFNGAPLTKRAKRLVGFVLQDDLLYESLTVAETLHFAAALRLPRSMTAAAKCDRVNTVITALGLDKCRDTIIGGFLRRGISGGERKRVSVGHELLIQPSVLLLDEPTSGLDATNAMRLITTLRSLAAGGRAVATTIHQPSSRLFQQLDKLLLLSEGHAIYYGTAALAADWFHRLGFTLPYGVSAADFVLDVASGDVESDARRVTGVRGDAARVALVAAYERFAALAGPKDDGYTAPADLSAAVVGDEDWSALRGRHGLAADDSLLVTGAVAAVKASQQGVKSNGNTDVLAVTSMAPARPQQKPANDTAPRFGAPYGAQIRILFTRAVKVRRFETLAAPDVAQHVVVGFLAGLFYWQMGRNTMLADVHNVNGLLFFEMTFLTFPTLFQSTFKFPEDFKMVLKERASGMYNLSAYYAARSLSDMPMEMTLPSMFIVISYFMAGLRLTAGAFFAHWAAMLLSVLVAQSLGMLIGAVVMDVKLAQACAAIFTLATMLVSGFFVSNMPVWIAWMKYLSYLSYGFNLLLKIQHAGVTYYDCGERAAVLAPASDVGCVTIPPGGLAQAVRLPQNTETWPWEAPTMVAWLVVLRYAVYVVLRRKTVSKVA